jgi:hypothetical protein
MNTKKWRQFLIEGDSQTLADQLENELNVKVQPDRDIESGKAVIYPNKSPGDQVYSSERMTQRITVKYDGGLKLVSIVGYERSMDLIGEPYNGTSMAMQGIWMPEGGKGIPLSMDALKIYVLQMKRGLEGESKAQADFYRDNKGYYKQDGRIGVGLSSQPRMK